MSKLLKYFVVGWLTGFVIAFFAFILLFPFKLVVISSLIFGFIYGLFCMGFMQRKLKVVSFEINPENKDSNKGLAWYEEKIKEQIQDMRFRYSKTENGIEIYKPTGLYKVLESPVELEVTPYLINVKCTRMMRRVILDLVELHVQDCSSDD